MKVNITGGNMIKKEMICIHCGHLCHCDIKICSECDCDDCNCRLWYEDNVKLDRTVKL